MNKSELLEKIKEKNEELESLNKELKEIILEEDASNLGKCFKQYLYSELYIYYKIIQVSPEYGRYKDEEYSISFLPALSFKYVDGLALMSSKVFEKLYKEVMEKINK